MFSPISVWLLLAKSKIFQVYWSIDFVILSVCLFVCLSFSPTGHNFKQIFTKLHHMVEFVIRKNLIVFEVKRAKGQHRPKVNNFGEFSKILDFHPIDLKFEENLYFRSLNSTTNYFRGQHWPKRTT